MGVSHFWKFFLHSYDDMRSSTHIQKLGVWFIYYRYSRPTFSGFEGIRAKNTYENLFYDILGLLKSFMFCFNVFWRYEANGLSAL